MKISSKVLALAFLGMSVMNVEGMDKTAQKDNSLTTTGLRICVIDPEEQGSEKTDSGGKESKLTFVAEMRREIYTNSGGKEPEFIFAIEEQHETYMEVYVRDVNREATLKILRCSLYANALGARRNPRRESSRVRDLRLCTCTLWSMAHRGIPFRTNLLSEDIVSRLKRENVGLKQAAARLKLAGSKSGASIMEFGTFKALSTAVGSGMYEFLPNKDGTLLDGPK